MLWKVINNALLTKDKLVTYGMAVDHICVICNMHAETVEHLFFDCPALKFLLNCISFTTGYNFSSGSSRLVWSIIYKATRWRCDRIRLFVVCMKIYMRIIWKERNAIVFDKQRKSMVVLWNEVKTTTHKQLTNCNRDFPDSMIIGWA